MKKLPEEAAFEPERMPTSMSMQEGIDMSERNKALEEAAQPPYAHRRKPMDKLWPGLDHIADFINALDSSDMSAKDVRTAIYSECLEPKHRPTPAPMDNQKPADDHIRALVEAGESLGDWLSAALDDSQVCDDMKRDITAWLDRLAAAKDYLGED